MSYIVVDFNGLKINDVRVVPQLHQAQLTVVQASIHLTARPSYVVEGDVKCQRRSERLHLTDALFS